MVPSRAGLARERFCRTIEYPSRVATGSGDRNQIREELPLSTRVHELAKELGLKSAELLERIQGWGLDVKASNFASLDPVTVDRIRELSGSPPPGSQPAGAAVARGSSPSGAAGLPPARSPRPSARPGPRGT